MLIKKKYTQNLTRKIKSYYELCKPNVMYLAILSALTGMFLAPGNISFLKGFFSIILISLGAGSAGAFNMYFEMEIDSLMQRTSKRPLPSWRLKKENALYFAIFLSLFSVFSLWFVANGLSAFLLALTISFYAFVYTLILKKRTIYNIVIGGIPGAIPPLIGWSVVMNSLSLSIFSLFLIIFFWIPPHSWALALFKIKEYKKVQIPMLPVVKGRNETIDQILIYSILLFFSSYLPVYFHLVSHFYILIASILNGFFLYFVFRLMQDRDDKLKNKYEKKLFFFSINYLFILLLWIICDRIFYFFYFSN
jgi:protoheme IX farnesyltransferase